VDLVEVVGAVRPRGCADREEVDLAVTGCVLEVGDEPEPAGLEVAGEQFVELRFVEPAPALVESVDLGRVDVDADDVVADLVG
jgi:hypothetical protein